MFQNAKVIPGFHCQLSDGNPRPFRLLVVLIKSRQSEPALPGKRLRRTEIDALFGRLVFKWHFYLEEKMFSACCCDRGGDKTQASVSAASAHHCCQRCRSLRPDAPLKAATVWDEAPSLDGAHGRCRERYFVKIW